ncbi:MAG: ABC transporter ATP-binding protein [Ignavibacteria bacterium]|jgi:putative ABC transport system ATP-binding protein|nr:ABC transporter ATP-binding protein [Ignavibacteria bacterium]MCU7502137.1 ABC transporter ATP-binding protein [Ignavibacteria bacterium]MCU7515539.1 ABC transporter ATP-binding protein [Ignavibacteria bacterium]
MQESNIERNNGYSPLIVLKDVSKSYTEENLTEHGVLYDVNAIIKKGEILIVLGRSGSGKSTILNLLSGIDLPTRGGILIDNVDITKLSEQERTLFRRKNIGFVFQFFNLIPTLTAFENLMLPLELNDMANAEGKARALNMLKEVGLSNRAQSYPDQLSGGEQQRIAIARALIHEPSIVLADEPTGNLDYETGLVIISLLDNLVRKKGKTMLMATHSREVIGLADRILTVKDGKIIELSASDVEKQ